MHYSDFGLTTTKQILTKALHGGYAIPAFNFYNIETLTAILDAAQITQSPIILAVSESALEYVGEDILIGMIMGAKYKKIKSLCILTMDTVLKFANTRSI